MSQGELAKNLNVHCAVIGRYERDEVKPSIEMAAAIAKALEISLDYLVGNSDLLLEKNVINKILDLQKLNPEDKGHVLLCSTLFCNRKKLKKCSLRKTIKPRGLNDFLVFYGCPTLCCWYALLLRPPNIHNNGKQ
ncbi:helix-turn-helix domain-containing protein [Ferruginibacter sp.]|uniref:helix-turn-helix domain-containing protein n=1 Tax=Ferruginibacter sp. TaxID=1940288 RepID=UPI002657E290|nr:helix-turn-helix transcriptional regulator [Ferruginibacter sp.]